MAYVKQGPWNQGSILNAEQATAMDEGIYSASLGVGVGSNLIGDPHMTDADSQSTLWTAEAGWTFGSGAWIGTNPSGSGATLEYSGALPVVESQIYRVRAEMDLSGNSTTGEIKVLLDWRDSSDAHVSYGTMISVDNADAGTQFYEGWAVVPSGVVSGLLQITLDSAFPATDAVSLTQAELVTFPDPAVVVLGAGDPVPSTLPAGSLIVRV